MPFVHLALRAGKSVDYRRALADGIHQAMVDSLGVPADDRFQIVTEHDNAGLIYDPGYLGVPRTDEVVLVHITLSFGRKPKQKRDFYARAAELLAQNPGLNPDNLVITLVETAWENWSFGRGRASYAE